MKINYVKGDATNPIVKDKTTTVIIPHVCNINGGWGAGFVLALSKKWKQPEQSYREWFAGKKSEYDNKPIEFCLGGIDPVPVEPNIIVVNMLAQQGYKSKTNLVPVRYWHLVHCMESVLDFAKRNIKNPTIHAPKFACDLGGASWDVVEQLIEDIWIANGIPVTIYLWEGDK